MKLKIFTCSVLFLARAIIGNGQFVPDTIQVKKVDHPPEIDGIIDDIWNNVPETQINNWIKTDGDYPADYDFSASFKMVWDDDYIFFLGLIEDDLVAEQSDILAAGAEPWEVDNWLLYWAPTYTQQADMSEIIVVRLGYANSNHEDATSPLTDGWTQGGPVANFVTGARALSEYGWIAECKFDLKVMAETVEEIEFLANNSMIGFNTWPGDNDGEEKRKHIGSWIKDAHTDQADTLGIIKLMADPVITTSTSFPAMNISLSPNPVVDMLSISADEPISKITITNSIGTVVKHIDPFNGQARLGSLKAGIYYIHVFLNDNSPCVYRILKE